MSDFILSNYTDKLDRQVIHMDQGVCYCPEYRSERMLRHYPSRKLQIARSIYTGELHPTERSADTVFCSLLSRQGERWQNFGEDPEDYTDVMLLCRAMLAKKGFQKNANSLKELLKANGGHVLPVASAVERWQKAIPASDAGDTLLLLDDESAVHFADGAERLGAYLAASGTQIKATTSVHIGWEYFACGMAECGEAHLRTLVAGLEQTGVNKVITLSAQAAYVLNVFVKKLGISPAFETAYLPDCLDTIKTDTPSYVYAGSFNLRYLKNAKKLNALISNSCEQRVPNCAEFTPLLRADQRVNELTIWQKPIGPEFRCAAVPEHMLRAIEADAARDIMLSGAKQVLSFEPSALPALRRALPQASVISYIDAL